MKNQRVLSNKALMKKAEAMHNAWFESNEGEIVKEAYRHPESGYSHTAKRLTISKDGTVRIRFSVTYPDGSSHRVVQFHRLENCERCHGLNHVN